MAQANLIIQFDNKFNSTTKNDSCNYQSHCFAFIIVLAILIFVNELKIVDYFPIDILLIIFLDITFFEVVLGMLPQPYTASLIFMNFIYQYAFGLSGTSTIANTLIVYAISLVQYCLCGLILYFKNKFWTRTICVFLSSFICKIELNKPCFFAALIQSIISSIIFLLANLYLTNYYNTISIIIIVYFVIFEYFIPYISSISSYLFFYTQLINLHKSFKNIKILTLFTAPLLIGCLLTDNDNYNLIELVINNSMNRFIAEPHIFCLAIIIARFALYYDLEMTNNLTLNLTIGLLVSKKFFSILPMLTYRLKLNVFYTEYIPTCQKIPSLLKTIFLFMRMYIINPNICFFLPVYIWSLITGSAIHLYSMNSYLTLPSSPRINTFWEEDQEEYWSFYSDDIFIEQIVYYTYLDSLRKKLYNMIKNGQLGIVSDDSFYLFLTNDNKYIILCHILSINSFSIDFQIRCPDSISVYGLFFDELNVLHELSECNYFRSVNIDKTPFILRSIVSPVAQNIELEGIQHLDIDIDSIHRNLSNKQMNFWRSYSLISVFHKNEIKFNLSELFDYPIPDRNEDDNINNNQLNKKIFDSFNFNGSKRRIYNFLNVIYREFKRSSFKILLDLTKDQSISFELTSKFPLFNHQNNPDHDVSAFTHSDTTDGSEYNLISDDDSELEIHHINIFNDNLTEYKVKWLIIESMKKFFLYSGLEACNIAPNIDDTNEVKEFIEYTENDYQFINHVELINSLTKLYNIYNILIGKTYNLDQSKKYYTIFPYNGKTFFVLMQNCSTNNWTVFRVHKEMVKSIWTSRCVLDIFFDDPHYRYYAYNKDFYRFHFLISRLSSLPEEGSAYISKIEKSTFM